MKVITYMAIPVICASPVLIWNQMKNWTYRRAARGSEALFSATNRLTADPTPMSNNVKVNANKLEMTDWKPSVSL